MIAAITPKIDRFVRIEVTEQEAEILCCLLGGIAFHDPSAAAGLCRELFEALDPLLPERTETFDDYFTGKVLVR